MYSFKDIPLALFLPFIQSLAVKEHTTVKSYTIELSSHHCGYLGQICATGT
jgi:hypothetical protein